MLRALTRMIDYLDSPVLKDFDVLSWGSPIPSFGDATTARVATVGLNPSWREFLDETGSELEGADRRFHTLNSLDLDSWVHADSGHLRLILQSCHEYFRSNPYDAWFGVLDAVIAGTGASYYGSEPSACHLDLIPFATTRRWNDLTGWQQARLLELSNDLLLHLLRESTIQLLILNGRGVVTRFESVAGVELSGQSMKEWTLPRRGGAGVVGAAYTARINTLAGTPLDNELLVLGFNHNLQSSYGVTRNVIRSIGQWVGRGGNG